MVALRVELTNDSRTKTGEIILNWNYDKNNLQWEIKVVSDQIDESSTCELRPVAITN